MTLLLKGEKPVLKVVWNYKDSRITEAIFSKKKKKKERSNIISDVTSHYRAIVTKTI
jgi:hypothetical protein